jgi:hypothetical protein
MKWSLPINQLCMLATNLGCDAIAAAAPAIAAVRAATLIAGGGVDPEKTPVTGVNAGISALDGIDALLDAITAVCQSGRISSGVPGSLEQSALHALDTSRHLILTAEKAIEITTSLLAAAQLDKNDDQLIEQITINLNASKTLINQFKKRYPRLA